MPELALDKKGADKILHLLKTQKSKFWQKQGEDVSLKLFHAAAQRVPAYKDFLSKNNITSSKIKTFQDFKNVPLTNKKNYIKFYPLQDRCWDGKLNKPLVFTSTSGTTDEPFYFPRGERLDWQASIIHEQFFKNKPESADKPTLVVVCFGMGVWIGGLITYESFEMVSRRNNLPISIITPGINKAEILKILKNLSPNYSQTILCGYPPFIKDVIDECIIHKINFDKLNLRIITAAEAYTEKFRDYISAKAKIKNPTIDIMNIYGTADIGAMAAETPLSILIRRLATKNKNLFRTIFKDITKTPTFAQYNSLFINFEALGEELIITGDNEIPLIRYEIGDHGGVLSFDEVVEKLEVNKFNLRLEAKKLNLAISEQSFVYVYERKDLSTTLYGLQIYPEIIKEALLEEPHSKHLTGRFSMSTKFDRQNNQYLEIHLEMKKGKKHSEKLKKQVMDFIVLNLRNKISEFRELHDYLKDRALPKLNFWPAEHPTHFKSGIKQKWVKK